MTDTAIHDEVLNAADPLHVRFGSRPKVRTALGRLTPKTGDPIDAELANALNQAGL